MKTKWVCASLVVVALLAASVAPSDAGGRRHWHGGPRVFVGFGVGPAWWYGPSYPYWYYPPPYVYAPPSTVVIQQAPVYVEQQPTPPAESAPSAPQQYWYYCAPAGGYYPSVPTCAEPWIKVPPRTP
jgi:hypothetical protein